MKGKLFIFILICLIPSTIFAKAYDHKVDTGKMTFEWKVDSKMLHIKLKAKTKGWLGIGFNPTKVMKNADVLIGRVKRGKANVRDDFATKEESHSSDKKLGGKSNVTNVSGKEEKGYTELEFTIPLNSKDNKDTELKVNGDTLVMLAFGRSDSYRLGHLYREVLKVNLKTGKYQKVK